MNMHNAVFYCASARVTDSSQFTILSILSFFLAYPSATQACSLVTELC